METSKILQIQNVSIVSSILFWKFFNKQILTLSSGPYITHFSVVVSNKRKKFQINLYFD